MHFEQFIRYDRQEESRMVFFYFALTFIEQKACINVRIFRDDKETKPSKLSWYIETNHCIATFLNMSELHVLSLLTKVLGHCLDLEKNWSI